MRNAHRPMGRFFFLLVVVAAVGMMPLTARGGAGLPFGVAAGPQGPALMRRALAAGVHAAPAINGLAMTQVVDTVYRADGTAAAGTVLISWPAFTTADGKAVAAGSMSVRLGSGGAFTASLAPSTGAEPAGVYYRVVYQLTGQEPSTEYWVVPATGPTSIGAVRAKLMPPTVAAQVLTRDVADTNYVHAVGDQTVNGVLQFNSSPLVPTPQNAGDAANKGYVDAVAGSGGNLSSPGPIGSAAPNTGDFTSLGILKASPVDNTAGHADGITIRINNPLVINPQVHNPVAGYFEINSDSLKYPVWGLNPVASATAGNDTAAVSIEADVNNYAQDQPNPATSLLNSKIGALIASGGTVPETAAIQVAEYANGSGWHYGTYYQGIIDHLMGFFYSSFLTTASITASTSLQTIPISGGAWPTPGTWVAVDHGAAQEDVQIVTGTLTSITAVFTKNHASGTPMYVYAAQYGIDFTKAAFRYSPLILGDLQWSAAANAPNPPNISLVDNSGTLRKGFYWDYAGVTHFRSVATGLTGWQWETSTGASLETLAEDTGIHIGTTFNWSIAQRLTSPDLNTITACGYYDANNATNAPTAFGSGFFKLQVVCSHDPIYVTQLAYDMVSGTQVLYERESVAGSWTGWAQAASAVSADGTMAANSDALVPSQKAVVTYVAAHNGDLSSPPAIGSATPNAGTFTTLAGQDLKVRDIPGHEYFVSKYANIQAAIDAAYNNGTVLGGATVIDDRLAPYSGPGFIVRDSVTLKLAATTYTIASTVSNNNGVSNVTAGIISMPGSHIVGAGTSANHGTNVNAGAGLNADLIATSTVGTGAGANAQWWHWGSIENFHMDGQKTSQTAGNCINVENMGETAVLRALEVGNCYGDDIRLEGNFATQSEISNVTVNSAGQFGVDLDNFQGVGVLRGLSGDSNATSIIRFNGSQSATLTVLGLKSEEEISGHDPLITIDMPADGSQPALSLMGGYTYARPGVHDVIKVINGKSGSSPFVLVSNFYVDANFVNAVNDTVNSRTFAASNMNKVPFSYLPTGSYQSGQAFTFAPGTFIQGGTSALTEIFGSSTDGSSMIAAQGNGDGTSYFTGGLKIGIPNRTQFGQPPEMMARMGSRFLGVGNGYDANTWVFVPIWKSGDSSNRWIGEPNQRWPEVYASDVNATTATVGTLNVTSCTGCGGNSTTGLLNYQTNTATLVGNASDKTIYTYSLPGGKMAAGTGVHCYLKAQRVSGTGAITYKWQFGGTTVGYASVTSSSVGISSDVEVYNNLGSTTAQIVNLNELHTGNAISAGGLYNSAAAENTANPVTIGVTFNGASTEQIRGATFKCMAEQ